MKFISLNGFQKSIKNPSKYKIDWDKGSGSKFQKSVKDFLQPYWINDIVFEELPIVGTRLSLDFYNYTKKLAIEVQGAQHLKFNKFMHSTRNNFIDQISRDSKKVDFCEINDIFLAEILPSDKIDKETMLKRGVIL